MQVLKNILISLANVEDVLHSFEVSFNLLINYRFVLLFRPHSNLKCLYAIIYCFILVLSLFLTSVISLP